MTRNTTDARKSTRLAGTKPLGKAVAKKAAAKKNAPAAKKRKRSLDEIVRELQSFEWNFPDRSTSPAGSHHDDVSDVMNGTGKAIRLAGAKPLGKAVAMKVVAKKNAPAAKKRKRPISEIIRDLQSFEWNFDR